MTNLWYRAKWIIAPRLKIVTQFPTHLDIELTNRCNLQCTMCRRDNTNTGIMSVDVFKNVFDGGIPDSVKLNWRGEPLMHPDLWFCIEYAKTIGVGEVAINTNGQLITEQHITDFNNAGLDWLIISVDGVTKETYEGIRKGGSFQTLLNNLVLVRKKFKGGIRIQICPQDSNIGEIEKWKEKFKPLADCLRVGKLHAMDGSISAPYSCYHPWRRLTISWDGNIYPCPADYRGIFKLGSIESGSIKKAWHSDRMNYLRNMLSTYGRSAISPCSECSTYC